VEDRFYMSEAELDRERASTSAPAGAARSPARIA